MEYPPKITHYCTLPHTISHHRTTILDSIQYSVTIHFIVLIIVHNVHFNVRTNVIVRVHVQYCIN